MVAQLDASGTRECLLISNERGRGVPSMFYGKSLIWCNLCFCHLESTTEKGPFFVEKQARIGPKRGISGAIFDLWRPSTIGTAMVLVRIISANS